MPGWNTLDGARRGWMVLCGSTAGLWLSMVLLGLFFARAFRESALENEATSGSLYVEGFLAPHARQLLGGATLPAESRAQLITALSLPPLRDKIIAFKLWTLDGKLAFSSDGKLNDENHIPADLQMAMVGRPIAELYPEGVTDENMAIGRPVIEVHAPIHGTDGKTVIAVGEIYHNAEDFLHHLEQTELTIWLAVGMTAVALSGVLLLHAAKRRDLVRSLEATRAMAVHNQALKENADHARLQASQINEELLNHLGAELHDGPIQMLSLLMLTQGRGGESKLPATGLSPQDIIGRTMADLRAISTGLVLPEITTLTLEDSLRLAVSRHEEITGLPVKVVMTGLPAMADEALKICCFRLVQEGLTNASRHGDQAGVQVNACLDGGRIEVKISNKAKKGAPKVSDTGRAGGLGLHGLRMRIAVFGGTLELERLANGGAVLLARIPLNGGTT